MANNQKLISLLTHACQCRDANCSLKPSCQKMKIIFAHTKLCKQKTKGDCPICRELIQHCKYHAKNCNDAKCPVPICPILKQKIQEQKLRYRLQQAIQLQRMAAKPSSVPPVLPVEPTTVHIEGILVSVIITGSMALLIFIALAMLKICIF